MKITQILDKTHRQLTFGTSILFIVCLVLIMVAGFFLEILLEIKLPFPIIAFAGGALTYHVYKGCVHDSKL